VLCSPSDRPPGELAAKVFGYYGALSQPIGSRKRTELQPHSVNRSRVVALPKNERTIRGFLGARLLVVDGTEEKRGRVSKENQAGSNQVLQQTGHANDAYLDHKSPCA
jgi:hypothetical protein